MNNDTICWTCSKAMTFECPKHRNAKVKMEIQNVKVYDCIEYDYDGECLNCPLNVNHIKGALYTTCPHFIKGCEGYCSQGNWKRGNYKLSGEE